MAAEAADLRRLVEARVYLLIFEKDSSRMVPLAAEGEVVLGRGEGVDVRVIDGSVSRKHARVSVANGQGALAAGAIRAALRG